MSAETERSAACAARAAAEEKAARAEAAVSSLQAQLTERAGGLERREIAITQREMQVRRGRGVTALVWTGVRPMSYSCAKGNNMK